MKRIILIVTAIVAILCPGMAENSEKNTIVIAPGADKYIEITVISKDPVKKNLTEILE